MMSQTQTFTAIQVLGLPETTRCRPFVIDTNADERFDAHVDSLPSLDNLIDRMKAADPKFDGRLQKAKEKRFEELSAEIKAGRLSRITAERLRLGITQAELARKAAMRQPNISRLEKPGATISVDTARRLARALGLDDYRVLLP